MLGGAEVALEVYEQVQGTFQEDEQTDTVLVRCYAEQGRVPDALTLIRTRVQHGKSGGRGQGLGWRAELRGVALWQARRSRSGPTLQCCR